VGSRRPRTQRLARSRDRPAVSPTAVSSASAAPVASVASRASLAGPFAGSFPSSERVAFDGAQCKPLRVSECVSLNVAQCKPHRLAQPFPLELCIRVAVAGSFAAAPLAA
jgi:hypothetical protein